MCLLERVLKPNYFKICASESCEAYLFQKVLGFFILLKKYGTLHENLSLVTYELLSAVWGRGEEERMSRRGRAGGGRGSGSEIGGPLSMVYHSGMSGNPLCYLFSKCKNSNRSRSSDCLLEGRLELLRPLPKAPLPGPPGSCSS